MPPTRSKSRRNTRGSNTRGRNTRGRNTRGNYPQNGARVITHAYKTYPLNVTNRSIRRAYVTIPKESTLANAYFIPKNGISTYGIDASILKEYGTKIPLNKNGAPKVDLDDGSIVYILFDDSTYALPYIYDIELGYKRDPEMDSVLNNNIDDQHPMTAYYHNTNFSEIEIYIYKPKNNQRKSFVENI